MMCICLSDCVDISDDFFGIIQNDSTMMNSFQFLFFPISGPLACLLVCLLA